MIQEPFAKLTGIVAFVCALLAWVMPLSAQTLSASSDGTEVWLIKRADGGIEVFHRDFASVSSQLKDVYKRQGDLAPAGHAAGDGDMWLVYKSATGLLFQSIQIVTPHDVDLRRFADDRIGRSLPGDIQLWSIDANGTGAWALVRALSARGTRDIEDILAREARRGSATLPPAKDTASPMPAAGATPPDAMTQLETAPPEAPEAPESVDAPEPAATGHSDRLLVLKQNRWVDGGLPADRPADGRKWVVTRNNADAAPLLLTLTPASDGEQALRVYERRQDQWQRQDHTIAAYRDVVPLVVDGQLLLACVTSGAAGAEILVHAVHNEAIYPIGTLGAVPAGGADTWTVLAIGSTAARVAWTGDGAVDVAQIDLQGRPVEPIVATPVSLVGGWSTAGWLLFVACIAIAVPILAYYWRRTPDGEGLKLPKAVVPADLMRRSLAAIIDILPAMVLVIKIYGLSFTALLQRVPARSVSLEDTIPYLVMLGLFVLHTMISEAMTGRTLGKYCMGLSVTQLDGKPITAMQAIVRNLLKIIEFIGWPLMTAPLMRPIAKQRLGDLVARTVVTAPREPDEAPRE